MPYPAQRLYPSPLLHPLEAGVEFVNFTKDFKRLVDRYGRSLRNLRTDSSFRAILNILSGTKCIGDNRTMKCGDAIAYVIPSLSYKLGDHITPISGRGEWVIVTERYASRIGDLRVFRVLGLERYTPGATLKGEYTIVELAIAGVNFTGVYALTEDLVRLQMLSRYDINAFTGLFPSTTLRPSNSLYPTRGPGRAVDIVSAEFVSLYTVTEKLVYLEMLSRYGINALEVPGIALAGIYNLTEGLVRLQMLSRYGINASDALRMELAGSYDVIALEGAYPSTTLYPSTSLYPRGPGRAVDIVSAEFVSLYTVMEKLVYLEMLSRYGINALEVPGIALAGIYNLTEGPVRLQMLSRYGINALEVPGIALAGIYNLTSKEVRKELVSSYDITKTPAQITGERSFVAAQNIDNYWNPWDDVDLSYYKVHRSLNNLFAPSDANLVGVPSTNSFKHTNLAAVTQYYFKVCAVTKLGVSGTYSAQFTATTA